MRESGLFLSVLFCSILIATLVYMPSGRAEAGEVFINSADDTYVDYDASNQNFGNLTEILVWSGGASEIVTWLKFGLSGVPSDIIVDAATLQLWATSAPSGLAPLINIHSCSGISWTEMTLTYSNMLDYNSSSMDSEQVSAISASYNWEVVEAVRKGVSDRASAITFVLDTNNVTWGDETWAPTRFASKENEIHIPRLIVHWSQSVPEYQLDIVLFALPIVSVAIRLATRTRTSTRAGELNNS